MNICKRWVGVLDGEFLICGGMVVEKLMIEGGENTLVEVCSRCGQTYSLHHHLMKDGEDVEELEINE